MKGYKHTELGWIPEDWSVKSFQEVADFKNGLNFDKSAKGRGIKIIGVSDFQDNFSIKYNGLEKISVPENISDEYFLRDGDLLFVRSNGNKELIGRVLYIKDVTERISHSGFTIRARVKDLKEILPLYVGYLFNSSFIKGGIQKNGGGTNISNLSQEVLGDLLIPYPAVSEQKRISNVFYTWDKSIESLTQLIAAKQQLKKGLMQQLLTGKKRLPGFKEKWKTATVGQVCMTFSGGTPERKNKEYYKGNIPWIKSGELNLNEIYKTEESITEDALENSSAKIVQPETVLLALYGATAGVLAVTKIKAAINQAVLAIIPTKGNLLDQFLFYYLENIMPRLIGSLVQGGQPNLNAEIVKSISISIPEIKEQERIINILKSISTEVKMLNDRRESIIQQKQGLMQQLLTGKKRVKV